jgi:hypothetical protein
MAVPVSSSLRNTGRVMHSPVRRRGVINLRPDWCVAGLLGSAGNQQVKTGRISAYRGEPDNGGHGGNVSFDLEWT